MKLALVSYKEPGRYPVAMLRYTDTAQWDNNIRMRVRNMLMKGVTKNRIGKIMNIGTFCTAVSRKFNFSFVAVTRYYGGLHCRYYGFRGKEEVLERIKKKVYQDACPLLQLQLNQIIRSPEIFFKAVHTLLYTGELDFSWRAYVNEMNPDGMFTSNPFPRGQGPRDVIQNTLVSLFLREVKLMAMKKSQWESVQEELNSTQEIIHE